MNKNIFTDILLTLLDVYPVIAYHNSPQGLWVKGLNDGIVTREEYDWAKDYYGSLWNCAGD